MNKDDHKEQPVEKEEYYKDVGIAYQRGYWDGWHDAMKAVQTSIRKALNESRGEE